MTYENMRGIPRLHYQLGEQPHSEHGLVLFGQAGTGKSSIAHEIA